MTNKEYAEFLLPNIEYDKAYYESKYPKRNLSADAIVTRIAPSPTGFVHIGSLFQAIVVKKLASQSGGVAFMRIEDTDQKRKIDDGINLMIDSLAAYDISFDECPISETESKGNYGPYIQSQRKEIYQAFAKYLIEQELAYPSFANAEDLDYIRKQQEARKTQLGYYGSWAKDRFLSQEEVFNKIDAGIPYVIRLKSPGDHNNVRVYNDCIRGEIKMPENDIDEIIIKSDGLPTYHFAHFVDDYLMGTTHVLRGEEWLSSLPKHIQMFEVFGVNPPKYTHTALLLKEEDGKRRKISKRKDVEADVMYYKEQGIPVPPVKTYLYTVANSNFEEWKDNNLDKDEEDFILTFDKMNNSGALFDLEKIMNLSKTYLSSLSAKEVYEHLLEWTKTYDQEFFDLITKYQDKTIATLNIERETPKPRKDFGAYSEIKNSIWYMYNELFDNNSNDYEWKNITDLNEIKNVLNIYFNQYYNENDDQETWFNKVKELCDTNGYASNMKEYKKNPEDYKGNVADISTIIRVAITKCAQTPNLYDIMSILGKAEMLRRIELI